MQGRERGGPYFDEPTVGHGPAVCFLRQQQKTKYMRAKRNTLSTSLAFFSVFLFPSPPLSYPLPTSFHPALSAPCPSTTSPSCLCLTFATTLLGCKTRTVSVVKFVFSRGYLRGDRWIVMGYDISYATSTSNTIING